MKLLAIQAAQIAYLSQIWGFDPALLEKKSIFFFMTIQGSYKKWKKKEEQFGPPSKFLNVAVQGFPILLPWYHTCNF